MTYEQIVQKIDEVIVNIDLRIKQINKKSVGNPRKVVICTTEGSYAQKFAEENGYKVIIK